MISQAMPHARPDLMQRWREQIARQRRRRAAQGPRPLAAIGYLVHGPTFDGFVDLRRLQVVRLIDEVADDGYLVTRVSGFGCLMVRWGVRIGGPRLRRFNKDLTRAPGLVATGGRFSLAQPEVLSLALDLDRYLDKHRQFPHLPRFRQPDLPALWAGFEPRVAADLCGAGPELESVARRSGRSPMLTFRASNQTIRGQEAWPLAFVSHAWQRISTVYAEVGDLRRRQLIGLESGAKALSGFSGAVQFDLR